MISAGKLYKVNSGAARGHPLGAAVIFPAYQGPNGIWDDSRRSFLYCNNDEIVMAVAYANRSPGTSFFLNGDVVCLRGDMLVLMDPVCLEAL